MAIKEKGRFPEAFGKYQLVELIAQGGMAEIFRAKSYGVSGFEKTIVIKRILPSYSDNREFIEMLIDEAKICAGLQHANIIQIYDLGRLEGRYFIAMEFVRGVDLVTVLTRLRKAKRLLPIELVCYVLSEALNGLEHAHRAVGPDNKALDIIHRDFNPANILLSYEGQVKVADFGIARAADRGTKTSAGGLKGKMGYLSPEQVADRPLDHRSDIFTAGITLWETLSARRMFTGGTELDILLQIRDTKIPDIRKQIPEINPDLVAILDRALQKNPDDRFRSAREFKDALDDFLFDNGVKVTSSHLEGYVKHLFADLIDEENQRTKTQEIEKTRLKPPSYWVRKTGQKVPIGPIDMEKLSGMLSNGEVSQFSEVLREGGKWKPVREVPELAVHISKLPTAEESDPDAVASYQGLIAEVSFPKLFYRVAIAEETGRLVLTRQSIKKEIYIRKGMPEFVKSNIPSERLGEYLISVEAVTEQQRDQAVRVMKGFSGRLGDTLIGLGFMQGHDLFGHLQKQVKEKILEVFSWIDGTYRFFSGQTYQGEVVPLQIGNYALIAEGVRKYTSIDLLKTKFRPRLDKTARRIPNHYLKSDKLGLSAREQRVADSVDGERTFRDLLTMGGSERQEFERAVYQVMYILEELEMLEFV
ncbi:MAG: protein kinase [Deltaproteobacteria bacterium]|nr:protein kinase [Deltaproteobacteria bacterium]